MRIEKGDVHLLPFPREVAGMQCRQDCGGGKHPGGDVNDRDADARRRSIHRPGDAHHSALSLEDRVVTGTFSKRPRASISADGAVNQFGVETMQVGVAQSQFIQIPGAIVLDQHVRDARQLTDNLLPFRTLNIDRQAALVAIGRDKICRFARIGAIGFADERRTPAAAFVAAHRPFHFDHICAQISQHHCAVGACQGAGYIQNSNVI